MALTVVFATFAFVSAADADGWAGLARVAAGILAFTYLVGVAVATAANRYLVGSETARVVLAVTLPPATLLMLIFLLRLG